MTMTAMPVPMLDVDPIVLMNTQQQQTVAATARPCPSASRYRRDPYSMAAIVSLADLKAAAGADPFFDGAEIIAQPNSRPNSAPPLTQFSHDPVPCVIVRHGGRHTPPPVSLSSWGISSAASDKSDYVDYHRSNSLEKFTVDSPTTQPQPIAMPTPLSVEENKRRREPRPAPTPAPFRVSTLNLSKVPPAGTVVFHKALVGMCACVQPEQMNNHGLVDSVTHHPQATKIFVGQVRLELTATQISGMFKLLAGVTPLSVVPHGPGCYFAYFNPEDADAAKDLHNRVLFDKRGLWFAQTEKEATFLQEYVLNERRYMKNARLPRATLVVRR